MPKLGTLIVARARKTQRCGRCKRDIEVGEWYRGLVGRSKKEGIERRFWPLFTIRYHRFCFSELLGWVEAGRVSHDTPKGKRVGRRATTAHMTPEARTERKRLVWLRNYHLKAGHAERVVAINSQIEATGVPAPYKAQGQELTREQALASSPVQTRFRENLVMQVGQFKSWADVPGWHQERLEEQFPKAGLSLSDYFEDYKETE